MNFHRKKIILITILLLFFSLRAYSYYYYISDSNDLEILLQIVTGYAGYNAIIVHGTIYMLLFLLGYLLLTPPIKIQGLIRHGRRGTIKIYKKQLYIWVLVFVSIFTIIYMIYVICRYDLEFLIGHYFFIGCILELIATFLVYALFGELYVLFYLLLLSKAKACALTLIVSVVMVVLTVVYQVWLPFALMDVFDRIYENGLPIIRFIIECSITILIILGVKKITGFVFEKKDVI